MSKLRLGLQCIILRVTYQASPSDEDETASLTLHGSLGIMGKAKESKSLALKSFNNGKRKPRLKVGPVSAVY
jgi:hypothetical protein